MQMSASAPAKKIKKHIGVVVFGMRFQLFTQIKLGGKRTPASLEVLSLTLHLCLLKIFLIHSSESNWLEICQIIL